MVSGFENITILMSTAVNILACELGIFSLNIGKNLDFLALGMVPFTDTSYIRGKHAEPFFRNKIDPMPLSTACIKFEVTRET
jgi:hypothetical protein